MKPVICFGEALIDFLMINATQQENLKLPEFRQYPGGAPANAAVAIAKLGGLAKFAGQVGDDSFGHFLAEALKAYGVDTQFLQHHPSAKTALAFVSLDDDGERSFAFHRDGTADVILTPQQVSNSWFKNEALLHFCSNTLTTNEIAKCTEHVLKQAQDHQTFISFDVNLRHNLWPTGHADRELVNNLVLRSNLTKFAKEEFDFLCNEEPEPYLLQCFEHQCETIIITDGGKPLRYHTPEFSGTVTPPQIKTVDTTAGGDAFVGGLLRLLSAMNSPSKAFESPSYFESILMYASHCGALAVSEAGAFPALPDMAKVTTLYSVNNQDISDIQPLLEMPN